MSALNNAHDNDECQDVLTKSKIHVTLKRCICNQWDGMLTVFTSEQKASPALVSVAVLTSLHNYPQALCRLRYGSKKPPTDPPSSTIYSASFDIFYVTGLRVRQSACNHNIYHSGLRFKSVHTD